MADYHGVELAALELSSERLTLRPWRPDDAPAVLRTMQHRAMHEFLAVPDPYTQAAAVEFVTKLGDEGRADGTGLGCAVVESAAGRFVGSAALRLPTGLRADADIGYWVAPAAQGNGYAAEVTRTLAEWAFAHDVYRVELHCDVRNLASARTALSAGFAFEGVRRDYLPTAAGRMGLATFARTAQDGGASIAPSFARLPPGGLSDGTLTLRTIEAADASALAGAEDPVALAIGFTGRPHTPAEVRRSAARAGLDWLVGSAAPLAMVDVDTGRCAGSLRLRLAGPPNIGGIGYAVHPDFRGRGYTARALRLLVPWAFDAAGFARLELGAKVGNAASLRAAQHAGFGADGVRRSRLRNPDGTFSDEVRYALVNPSLTSDG